MDVLYEIIPTHQETHQLDGCGGCADEVCETLLKGVALKAARFFHAWMGNYDRKPGFSGIQAMQSDLKFDIERILKIEVAP